MRKEKSLSLKMPYHMEYFLFVGVCVSMNASVVCTDRINFETECEDPCKIIV